MLGTWPWLTLPARRYTRAAPYVRGPPGGRDARGVSPPAPDVAPPAPDVGRDARGVSPPAPHGAGRGRRFLPRAPTLPASVKHGDVAQAEAPRLLLEHEREHSPPAPGGWGARCVEHHRGIALRRADVRPPLVR